ncbi:MAG TPA: porin, partial [Bacteroidales bacterium]|nr:porin [Bacteroidales bacterium]
MKKLALFSISFLFAVSAAFTQTELDDRASVCFNKGWGFATKDSSIMTNLRFRIQNRFSMFSMSDSDLSINETEFKVRRLRLRFDGFVFDHKISYLFQLAFSRDDIDWDKNKFPSLVRDAMVFYKPISNLQIGFGQGKLPGNRQRVISSGQQQFADRSIVNSNFTLDRDFGFFVSISQPVGIGLFRLRAAVTSGEGRNIPKGDANFAYTGRIEYLPFGIFTNDGDYFEGDLDREPKPRLSLAGGYSFNKGAIRTGGQLGSFMDSGHDIMTLFADMVFKFRGWAFSSEFIKRDIHGSAFVTLTDGTPAYIVTGYGINTQLSYCFANHIEIAARHSVIIPDNEIRS